MIVHSDGLDEISTMGTTKIMHLKAGKITESTLDPADYGIKKASLKTSKAATPKATPR